MTKSNKEQERLLNMLKENKISADEHKLLLSVIHKKPSRLGQVCWFLINPFQKIAGIYALVIGLFVIFSTSYFEVIAKCYAIGIMGVLNASVFKAPKIQPNFFLLAYQNLVGWLILAVLFIICAKIFNQKRLRLLDFFGTVALARFPLLILAIFLSIVRVVNPSFMDVDIEKGLQFDLSMMKSIFGFIVALCVIWEIATYFHALKESSGLIGKKLWGSFIGAIILGETIAGPLTMIFF